LNPKTNPKIDSGSSYQPYYSYAPDMNPNTSGSDSANPVSVTSVSENSVSADSDSINSDSVASDSINSDSVVSASINSDSVASASASLESESSVSPSSPSSTFKSKDASVSRFSPSSRPDPQKIYSPKKETKKSNKGIWAVFGAVLILFVLVFAVYVATDSVSGINSGNKIAVIHISGTMYTGDLAYGSGYAGSDSIAKHIRAAADNSSVKGIVLRIDSPGGTASCSQEINAEIKRAQEMGIPVVTSMADQATSAAYYVASQTDYIYATPSTITGSIGVYSIHYDKSAAYDEAGIEVTLIKSGELKDMGSDHRALTDYEKKYMQSVVDDLFRVFVNDVASGRNMTYNEVLSLSDGRYYTGTAAKENGLIDDFGNLYEAADKAAELAGIGNYTLYYPDSVTLSSLLF